VSVSIDQPGKHGISGKVGHGNSAWSSVCHRKHPVSGKNDVSVASDCPAANVDQLSREDGCSGPRFWLRNFCEIQRSGDEKTAQREKQAAIDHYGWEINTLINIEQALLGWLQLLRSFFREQCVQEQQTGSNDDRRIGNVEVGPVVMDDVDFEEIDH